MNPTHYQLTTASPPEVWFFVSDDPDTQQRVGAELETTQDPYVAWRQRHGLVRCIAARELLPALRRSLEAAAPMVHLFHAMQPGALRPLLGMPMKVDDASRVRMVRLSGTTAQGLVEELCRPDGGVEAAWLFSGRRERPAIDASGHGSDFIDEEARAFEHWAAAFVARHGADEIDAIFGRGASGSDEIETQQPEPDDDDFTAPPADLLRWNSRTQARRPWQDEAEGLGLAASPAATDDLAATPFTGRVCRASLLSDPGNRFSADGEVVLTDSGPAKEPRRRRVSISLAVWGDRWKAPVDRVLSLVPQRRRPLLLSVPATTHWQTWPDSPRRVATLEIALDLAMVKALSDCSADMY